MHIVYLLDGLLDSPGQIVHIYGLRSEIKSTVIHSLTDVRHVAVRTHHNDTHGWVVHLIHLGQQRQAVHLWHVDIAEDNLNVGGVSQDSKSLKTVTGEKELILSTTDLTPEMMPHHQLNGRLIINTQNLYCRHSIFS